MAGFRALDVPGQPAGTFYQCDVTDDDDGDLTVK
jgi:hypothetical protein